MQYVRSLGGSVSKTWNSINPATLSGAIDVIVVEQEDGQIVRRYQCAARTNEGQVRLHAPLFMSGLESSLCSDLLRKKLVVPWYIS